jgi:hypothetical protein
VGESTPVSIVSVGAESTVVAGPLSIVVVTTGPESSDGAAVAVAVGAGAVPTGPPALFNGDAAPGAQQTLLEVPHPKGRTAPHWEADVQKPPSSMQRSPLSAELPQAAMSDAAKVTPTASTPIQERFMGKAGTPTYGRLSHVPDGSVIPINVGRDSQGLSEGRTPDVVPSTVGSAMGDASTATIADRVAQRLESFLGPHTARVAVKTFAHRGLGRGPETLVAADIPTLVATLKPMLRTIIGKDRCELVAQQILREFGL